MSNFGDQNFIKIASLTTANQTGRLQMGRGARHDPCALGKHGQTYFKKEGDGKTPNGRWRPVQCLYRPDRISRPKTALPTRPLKKNDGWCDAPHDRNYNRPVNWPYTASAEHLWRDDELYDIIIILNHNQRPRIQHRGSAIFMHVAKPGYPPTEGCLALAKPDLLRLLPHITPSTRIYI